jgi:hypothetical protein
MFLTALSAPYGRQLFPSGLSAFVEEKEEQRNGYAASVNRSA